MKLVDFVGFLITAYIHGTPARRNESACNAAADSGVVLAGPAPTKDIVFSLDARLNVGIVTIGGGAALFIAAVGRMIIGPLVETDLHIIATTSIGNADIGAGKRSNIIFTGNACESSVTQTYMTGMSRCSQ